MLPNAAVRNLIREEKTHQIYSQMQMGQGGHGMLTMNQSLFGLVQSHTISRETAFQYSHDIEELNAMFNPSATSVPKRR